MATVITDFTNANTLIVSEFKDCPHHGLPGMVLLHKTYGPMALNFSMTPEEARKMATALIQNAAAVEAKTGVAA